MSVVFFDVNDRQTGGLDVLFPDFSAFQYVGRMLDPAREGHFRATITELRQRRITRILAPNHYHEHIDHLATYLMAAIISALIEQRKARQMKDGRYIEVYRRFDPRPIFDSNHTGSLSRRQVADGVLTQGDKINV